MVRGDPGVGKTALLGYLAGQASGSGCRIVRATGVPGPDATLSPPSSRPVHLPSTGRVTGQGYPRDITGALRGLAREGEVMPLVKGNPDELAAPLICSCRTALA